MGMGLVNPLHPSLSFEQTWLASAPISPALAMS